MLVEFTKMHGTGNDFVFIDDLEDRIDLTPQAVRFLCDRHRGIGADGVIMVKPSKIDDCVAYMHYINGNGTLAQMCGNGVRCFAKYLVDHAIALYGSREFMVETLAGVRRISFTLDEQHRLAEAEVDMGRPSTAPATLPTLLVATSEYEDLGGVVLDAPIDTPSGELAFTCVSMGNPHAITFVDDPATFPLETVGPYVEALDIFPEKTNVEFAAVKTTGERCQIDMRVWERGCGETLACGTGCCATAVAAHIAGLAPRECDLNIRGGQLHIHWRESDGHVLMTGPATTVYEGSIRLEGDLEPLRKDASRRSWRDDPIGFPRR